MCNIREISWDLRDFPKVVSVLHQNEGGKSILDTREISWDPRDFPKVVSVLHQNEGGIGKSIPRHLRDFLRPKRYLESKISRKWYPCSTKTKEVLGNPSPTPEKGWGNLEDRRDGFPQLCYISEFSEWIIGELIWWFCWSCLGQSGYSGWTKWQQENFGHYIGVHQLLSIVLENSIKKLSCYLTQEIKIKIK